MQGSQSQATNIETGIADLDKWVRIAQGDLVIIAGRPSIGKSTWAYNVIRSAANKNTPVLLVTLEVRPAFVAMPMLAAESRVGMHRLQLPHDQITDAEMSKMVVNAGMLSELPVKITEERTVEGIAAQVRREARLNPDMIVLIDYLQLVVSSDRHGNREQEVSHISRSLKNIAMECKVPIIALAQLHRLAEKQRPRIENLRESGAIEQDADTVLLLHSDDYQKDSLSNNKPAVTEIIIGKQRRGKTGSFRMMFRKDIARFDGYSKMEDH
jgi:replicative DNA helicase